MRQLLLLPFGLMAFGCSEPDPVWALPCDQRPEREVIPGTGEDSFRPVENKSVAPTSGSQGGSHIWFSVRLRGFGPEASVRFGIFDAEDSSIVYSGPNAEHVELSYNSQQDASEAAGMFAFLSDYDYENDRPAPSPRGQSVIFWADVSDQCTEDPVHGETASKVF